MTLAGSQAQFFVVLLATAALAGLLFLVTIGRQPGPRVVPHPSNVTSIDSKPHGKPGWNGPSRSLAARTPGS